MSKLRDYFVEYSLKDLFTKPYLKLLKIVGKGDKSLTSAEKKEKKLDTTRKKSIVNIKGGSKSLEQQTKRLERLQRITARLDRSSNRYKKLSREIDRTRRSLERLNREQRKSGGMRPGASGGRAGGGLKAGVKGGLIGTLIGLGLSKLPDLLAAPDRYMQKLSSSYGSVINSTSRLLHIQQSLGRSYEKLSSKVKDVSRSFGHVDTQKLLGDLGKRGANKEEAVRMSKAISLYARSRGLSLEEAKAQVMSGNLQHVQGVSKSKVDVSNEILKSTTSDPKTFHRTIGLSVKAIMDVIPDKIKEDTRIDKVRRQQDLIQRSKEKTARLLIQESDEQQVKEIVEAKSGVERRTNLLSKQTAKLDKNKLANESFKWVEGKLKPGYTKGLTERSSVKTTRVPGVKSGILNTAPLNAIPPRPAKPTAPSPISENGRVLSSAGGDKSLKQYNISTNNFNITITGNTNLGKQEMKKVLEEAIRRASEERGGAPIPGR